MNDDAKKRRGPKATRTSGERDAAGTSLPARPEQEREQDQEREQEQERGQESPETGAVVPAQEPDAAADDAMPVIDTTAVDIAGDEESEEPAKPASGRNTGSLQRQQEDRMLVQRARTGDQLAYNELVKRHRHGVERLIRPMVRSASSDELDDLVQEALTKALLHLNSYSEEYAFSTWLYRIATNHAIDYLRRRKLNAFSISAPPSIANAKSEDQEREFEISDSSWVPDDVMMSDERTALIEAAIEQLPENYKRIIRLRHSEDMEYEEIARALNLPMGTVKVHLHRARAALAKMLEGKI